MDVEFAKPCEDCGGDHWSVRWKQKFGKRTLPMIACEADDPEGVRGLINSFKAVDQKGDTA